MSGKLSSVRNFCLLRLFAFLLAQQFGLIESFVLVGGSGAGCVWEGDTR